MQSGICDVCRTSGALNSYYYVGLRLCCPQCADAAAQTGEETIARAVDPTVCSVCGWDNCSTPLPVAGPLPYCDRCRGTLYARPFPGWLKISLAALLVLLVFGLARSVPYMKAERGLVRGERLIENRKYKEAAEELRSSVKVAPKCQRCTLLLSKALLLSGDPDGAYAAIDAQGNNFESSALFDEVKRLFGRADEALKESEEARAAKTDEERERHMLKASQLYPEFAPFRRYERLFSASEAFDAKDYDKFLNISQSDWDEFGDDYAAAAVASAYAAKYAVSGDEQLRAESERWLAKSESLVQSDAQRAEHKEYSERIRHRLATKEIISKEEYDRRFRGGSKEAQ